MTDRVSTIAEIKSIIGPAPSNLLYNLDSETQRQIDHKNLKPIDLDQYLCLAYDQEYTELLDLENDEDEIPMEEYEKPIRELDDGELQRLSLTLRRLLLYNPPARDTLRDLLHSPWFDEFIKN